MSAVAMEGGEFEAFIHPGSPANLYRVARVCALISGGTAAAGTLANLTTPSPGYNGRGVAVGCAVAASFAVIFRLRAGRLSMRTIVLIMALGNVALSSANYFSGPYAPRSVLIYLWMAVVVYGFFPRWAGVLHGALFAAGFATVLAFQKGPSDLTARPIAAWAISMATVLGIGAFLSWLVERVRRLAVTEDESRREAERVNEELEVVSRHKTEFLSNMSHELRTPLNAVIGFSEVLEDQLFGELNERQLDYTNDILTSGRHLLALINDILDLAKVEAGRMELDIEKVAVAGVIEAGMTMVRERATLHGITLEAAVEPDVGEIAADERKVRQVLFNLLSNAVKFTPAGGQVRVSARRADNEVEIEVADTGVGIETAELDRVFQAFEQVAAVSVAAHEGTGLGLALARRFVELHGGRIWVESEPGRGSEFTFRLPVTTREAAPVDAGEALASPGSPAESSATPAILANPRTPAGRYRLARVCAVTFIGAGAAGLLSAVLTGPVSQFDAGSLTILSALALVLGTLMVAFARRVPMRVILAFLALGNVLTTLVVYFSGPYAPRSVLVYMWLAVLVFGFFPRRVGLAHMALISVSYAVVLANQHADVALMSGRFATWFMVVGTATAVGYFVSWLVSSVRRLAVSAHRSRQEAERVRAQLELVSHHKTEFVANMSHELRTPLNAVIGFSEVLEDELFGPLNERQRDYVSDILTAGRHLLALINDILDLAKVEAGHMEIELGPVPVREVLEQGITMVRERATSHGITLECEADDTVGEINADERKMRQVVFNLLSNAVKFTPDGGRVRASARRVDGHVEVAVADTGIGIPDAHRDRIFEEFEQASTQHEGTGLGLALARRFVELHGGRIWVDSEPGEGSVFTVSLPA
ncbi:MAG: HAMP domain-containing histidine kinase [Actinobacteria bacterium]|nr:HAMP domain-containing histidine kinase [Actinomycetota bacterium]